MSSMTKRDVVKLAVAGKPPPYVPWAFGFTMDARKKLVTHFGTDDLDAIMDRHILSLGSRLGNSEDLGDGQVRDIYGVVWDRSVDADIGIVANRMLPEPTLANYTFPDATDPACYTSIAECIAAQPDRYRMFMIGFSLYERAWTLRGMENLMMDFYDHPQFVRDLFNAIADHNLEQVERALAYDIDAVYFGDDWGQQRGLQMGPDVWREFIKPVLRRMYGAVKDAGKSVVIHSCGDVDELFDDLVEIGLDVFNPFQPEVMDVDALLPRYRGRLAFFGGLSTQQTLPYGTPQDVRAETRHLIELGSRGGYILSPAHAVEGDVPLENMLAFIDEVKQQPAYRASCR